MKSFTSVLVALAITAVGVMAETHTVSFTNKCGHGTPTMVLGGNVVSTGGNYNANGPISGGIAYLQDGSCGFNGEGCTMVEFTLDNTVSSADVTLIPPHQFSVTAGFGYYGVCNGVGNDCTSAGCCPNGAFCQPTDYQAQRQCSSPNANLAVTFCD